MPAPLAPSVPPHRALVPATSSLTPGGSTWEDAGDQSSTELCQASRLLTSWAHHSQGTKGMGSTGTAWGDLARRGGTWHMGGARGVPRPANHSSPRCSSRSPRRVPPGAVAGSSGRFSTKMLAGPACSLPPLQQLLSCTFTSSSKGFFQNAALSRHNNKTTTLIFLAETSTKRVTQKTFLKFFFFPLLCFFPPDPSFFFKS